MDKDKMDKDKMESRKEIIIKKHKQNKYNKHNKLESYNFLKSIKDKEKTVLDYYKRITGRIQTKPLQKPKKLTRKNIINKYKVDTKFDNNDDNNDDELNNRREKPKTKIAPRGEEPKKDVIMD